MTKKKRIRWTELDYSQLGIDPMDDLDDGTEIIMTLTDEERKKMLGNASRDLDKLIERDFPELVEVWKKDNDN